MVLVGRATVEGSDMEQKAPMVSQKSFGHIPDFMFLLAIEHVVVADVIASVFLSEAVHKAVLCLGIPAMRFMASSIGVLQVLGIGTDTGETAASVLLFFDRERYVFNAGEGFQRYAVEHKIKLNRLSRILVTRLTTDATGGLPGICR